jgi:hypothetical protein
MKSTFRNKKNLIEKYDWHLKSEKEPKNRIEVAPRNSQDRPKILKKSIETKLNKSELKFSQKKVCLVPSKRKGAKNLFGSYPTEFVGSTQNPKKMIEPF